MPLPAKTNSGGIAKKKHRLRDLPTLSHDVLVCQKLASHRQYSGVGRPVLALVSWH